MFLQRREGVRRNPTDRKHKNRRRRRRRSRKRAAGGVKGRDKKKGKNPVEHKGIFHHRAFRNGHAFIPLRAKYPYFLSDPLAVRIPVYTRTYT